MDHYVGIDLSMELSSVCILDATGKNVKEAKVVSEPEALTTFLTRLDLPLTRIGLEAGPLSQWLHAALVKAGFEAVLLETRHVKAALSAMIVKTDRRDARGIAHLLRMGWFRPVHCKSAPAQEVRTLLVARKQLQAKMRDVELSLRGLLRGFGLKVGEIARGSMPRACARWWRGTRCWSRSRRRCCKPVRRSEQRSASCIGPCWRSFAQTRSAGD